MNFDELIRDLTKEFHLENLEREPNGSCVVLINDKFHVHLEPLDEDGFIIYTSICPLPSVNRTELLENVLQANLYGKQTLGNGFGIDKKSDSLILFRRFESEVVDYKHVKDTLNEFISVANHWTEEIFKGNSGRSEQPGRQDSLKSIIKSTKTSNTRIIKP